MQTWLQDLRFGLRNLSRNPGFAVVAIATLARGIGSSAAIFEVVNGVLLQPLPYPDPGRLLTLFETHDDSELRETANVTYASFLDVNREVDALAGVGAYRDWFYNLTGDGDPERLVGARSTPGLLPTLGVPPQLGRWFLPEEGLSANAAVAILSHDLWQRRYGGDPQVVGTTIQLNGSSSLVVGVMPRGFAVPHGAALWTPLVTDGVLATNRTAHLLRVVARRAPEVTDAEVETQLASLSRQIARTDPGADPDLTLRTESMHGFLVADARRPLLLLSGAVMLVLLIACANVANLLLAHATRREHEFTVRAALGAGRWRLIRQLLTESALIAGCGGVLGTALAVQVVQRLLPLAPGGLPRAEDVRPDGGMIAFGFGITLLAVTIFGIAPALFAATPDLGRALRKGDRGTIGGRSRGLRSALVVAEVALALVLLAGAGLLTNSFARLLAEETGVDGANVLTMQLFLATSRDAGDAAGERRSIFVEQVLDRVRLTPGIESAGWVNVAPLAGGPATGFEIEGRPWPDPERGPLAGVRVIDPGYLRAMRIPLLRGRGLSDDDDADGPRVMLISESLSRRYFDGDDPLGRTITMTGWGPPLSGTVVGIVGDVRAGSMEDEFEPTLYWPYPQFPQAFNTLVVRTAGTPESMIATVKSRVWQVDPDQPIGAVKTMEQAVSHSVADRRFVTGLLGAFSAVALLLAAIGLYGVISYSVTARTSEIGLRLALGARGTDVLHLVLSQGMRFVGLGLVIGLVAALALSRLLSGLLYEVRPGDPSTLALVSLTLVGVSAVACWIPARRAARIDPAISLRSD